MKMKRFNRVFYSIFGFCIFIMFLGFASFEIIEIDPATDWTLRYFPFPIVVVMFLLSNYIYTQFLIHVDTKYYASKFWIKLRTMFRILVLTFGLTIVSFGVTLSSILLTNAYFGNSKISVYSPVLEYHESRHKGILNRYVTIYVPQLKRKVELKVNKPFEEGELYEKQLYLGYWGLLYTFN